MSHRTVARRYAGALYEEAEATGVLEPVDDDVLMLRETLNSNGELARFFKSPVISQEKKDTVVRELLSDRVEDLTLRFLRLLIQKDRETLTKPILDEYQSLRDEQRGIVDADVTVARSLADEDREALTEALEEKTGKTVRLHVEEDADLIGGLIIRLGDHVFDASVRNKLTNLHDRLRESSLALDTALDTDGQAA
ncbi:MAG: F0F1 ATP synthase subunit delta [Bacteroidetes bacterium QH_7_62_13]|jgi:F-type H+-transporting ATPase subunit delta|nr:MAG: F0F1 ATP synthase subunit delta [Bacteroidetes bacterium QH_7_62_13]